MGPSEKTPSVSSDAMLRVSEARLKAIIDTAVDGILTIDTRGIVQSANPAAETLFGYPAEEMIGRSVNFLMPSPYRQAHDGYLRNYLETGTKKIIGIGREVVAQRKDGTVFPIFLSVGEMRIGEERLFTGIVRDITNLKEAEAGLKKANAELKRQVWVREGQAELATRLRGELALPELCHNVLTFLCEYLGADMGAFYLEREGVLHRCAIYAYAAGPDKESFRLGEGLVGQAARQLKPIVHARVPEGYVKVSSALGDTPPKQLLVVPIVSDKKAEAVLELASLNALGEEKMAFLAAVTESIGIGIRTAKSRRLQELLEQTQEQAAELEAQSEELRTTNEELAEQTRALRQSEAQLQSQQEELRQINDELEERSKTLQAQGETLQRQNDELSRAQTRLVEQARQLETSGKYKSEFLANMSHELRTPLNSILILAKLLSDNKGKNLTDEQVEFAQTIHSSGTDLIDLINDILDLSKVEAGKLSLHAENVAPADVVGQLEQTFRPVAGSRRLALTCVVEESAPFLVTDRARLEQILRNFLSNAFKFTENGEIALRAYRPSREEIAANALDPDKAFVAFAVSDTGIGIPPEKHRVIFEAFRQGDGTTSRKYGGTGLGLTISRELGLLLGGRIGLSSEVGKGTTFTLYLPTEWSPSVPPPTPVEPAEPSVSPKPMLSPRRNEAPVEDDRNVVAADDKTLLIIEDDPRFARILQTLAHDHGYKCVLAADGETGLELAATKNPKAIMLDLRLPGIDGVEVLHRIKSNPKMRHVPVHIVSVSEEHSDALLLRGAAGFLKKPVDEKELERAFARLERLLTRKMKRLLIVEDDKIQRESIRQLVGSGDLEVTAVATAKEALKAVTEERPDCVIMDMGLPDFSGFELLEQMAANGSVPPPPVIVYTARDVTPEEEERLKRYSKRIIIKGARSPERLLDEAMLFLHRVEERLPKEKQEMLVRLRDEAFEGKKVLLVDDDMRNVYALTKTLEDRGLAVVVGKNGKQALERLKAEPDIDLVLMDVMMPEMDGYTAMREIRKDPALRKIPILALTAKAMKEDRRKCVDAGANDYVSKPVDVNQLLTLLRVWMTRRS